MVSKCSSLSRQFSSFESSPQEPTQRQGHNRDCQGEAPGINVKTLFFFALDKIDKLASVFLVSFFGVILSGVPSNVSI
jgi:hypothetical protein